MRTPWGRYPEYHTSADDLHFVRPESLAGSLEQVRLALSIVDGDSTYVNLSPYGEPQLGRRGLYRSAGGLKDESVDELALLWVLNLSDSRHSLLDVAERSGLAFEKVRAAATALLDAGLLEAAAA
jgi:aminopeptidase-like protein